MPLLVTGTIGIDTVSTPTGHAERVLGGSAAYFAAAASFYGRVRIVAAVGEDFPDAFRTRLRGFNGIDLTGVETRRGGTTFNWGGRYAKNMNSRETLWTNLGVAGETPPMVPPTLRDSKFLFLANSHPSAQAALLDAVSVTGVRPFAVADTMDLWISTARPELLALLQRLDGLVLNYDEAEQLTGHANAVAAARHILELGPRFVVVKKGEHGSLFVHSSGIAAWPAFPAEKVVDPTGAGDSFAGGMMGYLASHVRPPPNGGPVVVGCEDLRRAVAHGTVVASFAIEAFSLDALAAITRGDIDKRFAEYAAMTRL